jgi:hypothetical protein
MFPSSIMLKIIISTKFKKIYSERQKYGINSLKIKQNFFQKIFEQANFSL